MESTITREDDGTIVLNITIPQVLIKKASEEILTETVKTTTVPGFRKGKAPKKIVEEKLDKEKVKEEALRTLLPQAYADAIKKHDIKPIINPRVHIDALSDDKDWQITATTTEAPKITLGAYKDKIKGINAKSKIVVGKEEPKGPALDEILTELLGTVNITVSRIMVEQEVERLLAQTLDEIKRLGLTLDQYLQSTKKTAENLKKEYELKAISDIKLEFTLSKIAEEEKITVSDIEIQEAINKAKDENEKKSLEANRYVLASIIRQQKTLDFLKNL